MSKCHLAVFGDATSTSGCRKEKENRGEARQKQAQVKPEKDPSSPAQHKFLYHRQMAHNKTKLLEWEELISFLVNQPKSERGHQLQARQVPIPFFTLCLAKHENFLISLQILLLHESSHGTKGVTRVIHENTGIWSST